MPPPPLDDPWSDDDDDDLETTDVQTAVQLGIPDGPLGSPADLADPTVSRIGGHPTFLASPHPPLSCSTCNSCSQPMELLVQIWCPLEASPNDRTLFVWGCANGICQRKEGSVRAWRELRYNRKYAEKLEKKLVRLKEKEIQQAKVAADTSKSTSSQSNPFAITAISSPSPFGLGSQIFGNPARDYSADNSVLDSQTESPDREGSLLPSTDSESEHDEGSEDENEDALAAAVRSTSLEDTPWKDAPGYPPLYLSTVSEYVPAPPKVKMPAGATADLDDDRDSKKDGSGWGTEGYENSMEVDHAFERFSKRVSYEGEQCLRYELKGTPLPYASDKVFNKLFTAPSAFRLPVTKSSFTVTPVRKRTYTPESLPACPHCKAPRVFECQLMPNLINVLRSHQVEGGRSVSDEERRAEVLEALKGQGKAGRRGMEWGTCMIFSCEKDCAVRDEERSTWREEYVLVQWDESM